VRTPPARTTILILHLRIKILQVVAGKILRVRIKDFQNGLYVLTTMTPTYRRAAEAIDFHSHLPPCRPKAHPPNDSHLQPLTCSTVARHHRWSILPPHLPANSTPRSHLAHPRPSSLSSPPS